MTLVYKDGVSHVGVKQPPEPADCVGCHIEDNTVPGGPGPAVGPPVDWGGQHRGQVQLQGWGGQGGGQGAGGGAGQSLPRGGQPLKQG